MSATTTTKPAATDTPPTDADLYTKAMEAIAATVTALGALKASPTVTDNSVASWAASRALHLAETVGQTLNGAALNLAADAVATNAEAAPAADAPASVSGASASTASASSSSHDTSHAATGGSSSRATKADTA